MAIHGPFIEGSLEVKLPTIWTDEKQRWEESEKSREEKKKEHQKRIKKRKSQKEEDPGARKGRKVAKHCVFPMIRAGGSKSRLAKAAGAEPAGQMRDEKLHAVVARSTCPSQKCKKLTGSEHFWKLRCRKSARRCGAKHISKSKCTKHHMFAPVRACCTQARANSQHFWTLKCRFAWQAHGIVHLVKSEQNVRVL